jgi:hypothetical protein
VRPSRKLVANHTGLPVWYRSKNEPIHSVDPRGAHAKMRGMKTKYYARLASAMLILLARPLMAQSPAESTNLPNAPVPKQDQNGAAQNQEKSASPNPIGLIAKKSYIYPDLATTSGPLTAKEKFELFVSTSISLPQILSSAASAGISEARGTLAGYGQGGEGYGKRFGSSMASDASSHFFGTFLFPAMLHEDPRFFVKVNGGFAARVGHALRRVAVIRTDVGGERFNLPGTVGPLLAEGLANVYLPQSERTASKTFQRYGIRIGFGAVNNLVKEYWPSIFKSLRIDKVAPGLKPDPNPPIPPGPPPD